MSNEFFEMEKERRVAIKIIDIFEDLLEEHNLTVPSKERSGEPEEARIFGTTYYEIEDIITDMLKVLVKEKNDV
jgi:hypothetical protein